MKALFRSALIASLLGGAIAVPAEAQPRRAPERHGPQAHGPQRGLAYHEIQASRGYKWRKGQRLNASQRRYVVSDWNRRGLRAPPRGYQWVRENNNSGDYLLVAAATGLIASILAQ